LHHPASTQVNRAIDRRLSQYRIGQPLPDDLAAVAGRLLSSGRKTQLLALATEGKRRYPSDRRFAEFRIKALELLGQKERARQESRGSGTPTEGFP
jgi:hypothetical protein